MSRLLAVISNLMIPGMGLIQLGRWRLACLLQLVLLTLTLILCWSRWVFEPIAIQVFGGLVAVLYVFSTGLCLKSPVPSPVKPVRLLLFSGLFMLVSLTSFASGFIFKQHWLGVHIYFVPSMSMHPTLKPGQFIVVDTWAYQDKTPELNDVIVFQNVNKEQWLVKRIAQWPDGKLQINNLWYVLGDNHNASRDSRQFGGIRTDQLVGQVKLVLLGIDQQHRLQTESILQVIR